MEPLLFLLVTSELLTILENKLVGYANDSTFITVVLSPGVRVALTEFQTSDLSKFSEWCFLRVEYESE